MKCNTTHTHTLIQHLSRIYLNVLSFKMFNPFIVENEAAAQVILKKGHSQTLNQQQFECQLNNI